jgi:hypothetical protein
VFVTSHGARLVPNHPIINPNVGWPILSVGVGFVLGWFWKDMRDREKAFAAGRCHT